MIFSWCYTTIKTTTDFSKSSNNEIGLVLDLEESDDLHSSFALIPFILSETPKIATISLHHIAFSTSFQSSISHTFSPFIHCERIIAISRFLI